MPERIAIIGANLAGGWAADSLRKQGFDGEITLIGEEPDPPYERPALSKEMLTNPDARPKTLFLHDADYYAAQRIDLRLNTRVAALDLPGKRIALHDGTGIQAGHIILCTGGVARRLNLPGAKLEGVHYLRTLADSRAIAAALQPGKSVAVIGGGVIGLEVAASARQRGCEVSVLETAPGFMLRVVSRETGQWLQQLHQQKGVNIYTGATVAGFTGAARVQSVLLGSGEKIAADIVIIGVGIDPADALARDAGITTGNGVCIDEFCRTSVPQVLAAGDVANQFNPYLNRRARLENVQAAQNFGAAAAAAVMGATAPHVELPFWWSDQYEFTLQAAGETLAFDQAIRRGTPDQGAFSVFYLNSGTITGVLCLNRPKEMAHGRRLIMKRARPDTAALADPDTDLRQIVQTA